MEKRMLIVLIGLFMIDSVLAGTINAQSCSLDHVKAALSSASNGDIVSVPSGTCTWNSGVTIPNGVTLQGAGSTATIITPGSNIILFNIYGASRLTGIRIKYGGDSSGVVSIKSGTGWRVDHCDFELGIGSESIQADSPGPGLIDHNIFHEGRIVVRGASSDYEAANVLWYGSSPVGTANAVYIEDNAFQGFHGSFNTLDSSQSSRYVARFNTVTDTEFMTHGYQFYGSRGPRSVEIYENSFHSTGQYGGMVPIYIRGGEGVVFNNEITGTWPWSADILLSHDRSSSMFLPVCDGISEFSREVDGNEAGKDGWLCRDQIGAGADLTLSSVSGKYINNPPRNGMVMSWGKQSRSPFYLWGNTNVATPNPATNTDKHVKSNRDYYDGGTWGLQTSKTSPFIGAAGTGRGTLANRPDTCTKGVGYWATDVGEWNSLNPGPDGQLYICASTNNWQLHYTPYTYPHPLQGGSCTPSCSGKQCGDNGCGGSCGSCTAPLTCSNYLCISAPTCSDECSAASRKCYDATSYQECGNFDTDTCLEWGNVISCESGQVCVSGYCQAPQAFLPEQAIEAEAGMLSGLQTGTSGTDTYVYTASDNTGSASYIFSIQAAGKYKLEARADNKNSGGENSFFVGLDSEPANGNVYYTYNVFPLQAGFFWDNVSRWGNGQSGTPPISEFDPMVWELSQGTHTFTFYGREANTWLDKIILKKACLHEADTDCDGCVRHDELMQYISSWKNGQKALAQLMEAIARWKSGC